MSREAPKSDVVPLRAGDKLALTFVLAPAVIDYRFENPNGFTLGFYGLLTVLALFGSLSLVKCYGLKAGSWSNKVALVAFLFLLETSLVGMMRGQTFFAVFRAMPPVLFFPLGLLAISALQNSGQDCRAVWRHVVRASVIALFVQLAMAIFVRGVDLATVRYQVLSGAAPLLTGYAVWALFFGGLSAATMGVIVLHVSVILLSVTRTQVAIGAAAALAAVIGSKGQALNLRRLGPALLGTMVLLLGIVGVGSVLPGAPLERWAYRLFEVQGAHHGLDITAVTREGEARYQMSQISSSTSGALFGFGLAAPTKFDSAAQQLVYLILGRKYADWNESGIGHNNYVGTVFVGGLLFGGALIFMQAVALWQALVGIGRMVRPTLMPRFGVLIAAPLAYISYLAFGMLGGTLAVRSMSMFMGITLALACWVYDASKPAQAPQRPGH